MKSPGNVQSLLCKLLLLYLSICPWLVLYFLPYTVVLSLHDKYLSLSNLVKCFLWGNKIVKPSYVQKGILVPIKMEACYTHIQNKNLKFWFLIPLSHKLHQVVTGMCCTSSTPHTDFQELKERNSQGILTEIKYSCQSLVMYFWKRMVFLSTVV